LEIILIAAGLSMDAFAVSITLGMQVKKPSASQILSPAALFGLFQAAMPIAGYFAGTYFAHIMRRYDKWAAFALLSFLGLKMVKESFSKEGATRRENQFRAARLLALAFATSIDALAAGLAYALLNVNIFKAALLTGAITFLTCAAGVRAGSLAGAALKSKATLAGAIVLIAIGVKILLF
jgi:putative Mn2+ efflux pump MntP